MFQNKLFKMGAPALVAAALMLAAGPALACGDGWCDDDYDCWDNGYDYCGGCDWYGYSPWYGDSCYSKYYSYPAQYTYSYTTPSYSSQVFYPISTTVADTTAVVNIRVPANAEVWFDNHQTSMKGTERKFESPALTPGERYSYTIRAHWMENSKPIDQTRRVDVWAGAVVNLDFLTGSGS